jgi:hypothetical protein
VLDRLRRSLRTITERPGQASSGARLARAKGASARDRVALVEVLHAVV